MARQIKFADRYGKERIITGSSCPEIYDYEFLFPEKYKILIDKYEFVDAAITGGDLDLKYPLIHASNGEMDELPKKIYVVNYNPEMVDWSYHLNANDTPEQAIERLMHLVSCSTLIEILFSEEEFKVDWIRVHYQLGTCIPNGEWEDVFDPHYNKAEIRKKYY